MTISMEVPPGETSGGARELAAASKQPTGLDAQRGRDGGPFPLPVGRQKGASSKSSDGREASLARRRRESVKALNRLDAYGSGHQSGRAHGRSGVTPAQRRILRMVARRTGSFGSRPDIKPAEACKAWMKLRDIYGGEPVTVVPYDPRKLRLLEGRARPQPLLPLLPDWAADLVRRPGEFIERSLAGVETLADAGLLQVPWPYWDRRLRSDRPARPALCRHH